MLVENAKIHVCSDNRILLAKKSPLSPHTTALVLEETEEISGPYKPVIIPQ